MIVLLKMHASGKIFDKIFPKAIFFQYMVYDQGIRGFNFLVDVISNIRGKFKLFGFQGGTPRPPPPPSSPTQKKIPSLIGTS